MEEVAPTITTADDSHRSGNSESSFYSHLPTMTDDSHGHGNNAASSVPEVSPPTPHKENYLATTTAAAAAARSPKRKSSMLEEEEADEYSPRTLSTNSASQQQQQMHQQLQKQEQMMMMQSHHLQQQSQQDKIQSQMQQQCQLIFPQGGNDANNLPQNQHQHQQSASSIGEAPASASELAASSSSASAFPGDKQSFLYALYDILSHSNRSSCSGTLFGNNANTEDQVDQTNTQGSGTCFSQDPTILSGRTPSGIPFDDIISWLPHGKGFIITNKPKFEKEILPTFLPNTKYASFTRRLKRWKFVRVSSGIEMGSYYHPHFQRAKPHLIHLINTNDAPLQDCMVPSYFGMTSPGSGSSSNTPSSMMRPTIENHQKMFADIRLPYSDFGAASSGPRHDPHGCGMGGSGSANPDVKPHSDVRDFPQIMRQISKAKRLESLKTKRQSIGDEPSIAGPSQGGMGSSMMGGGGGARFSGMYDPSMAASGKTQDPAATMMAADAAQAAHLSRAFAATGGMPPGFSGSDHAAMMASQFNQQSARNNPFMSAYWESGGGGADGGGGRMGTSGMGGRGMEEMMMRSMMDHQLADEDFAPSAWNQSSMGQGGMNDKYANEKFMNEMSQMNEKLMNESMGPSSSGAGMLSSKLPPSPEPSPPMPATTGLPPGASTLQQLHTRAIDSNVSKRRMP